jgi:hypothetical protein
MYITQMLINFLFSSNLTSLTKLSYCTSTNNNTDTVVLLKDLPNDVLPKTYVICYDNLSHNKLLEIKRNYKRVAGIYLWYNNINGKTYVGRSVNIKNRLEDYLDLTNYKRNNSIMSIFSALRKYGFENFKLYIIY